MQADLSRAEFDLGDVVWLRARDDNVRGMVTGVTFRPGGGIMYDITWGTGSAGWHYACELSRQYVPVFTVGED